MAAVATRGTPSLASLKPGPNEQIGGLRAGENITGGQVLTVRADGLVYLATGADTPRGIAFVDAQAGEAVTPYRNVRFGGYSGLTPGNNIRLSATVAGGLDDDQAGTGPILGFAVDAQRIQFTAF